MPRRFSARLQGAEPSRNDRARAEAEARDHPLGYVRRDWRVVDYEPWRLEVDGRATAHWLRGPPPELVPGGYLVAVGAAQTFGCFVERPWPSLLGSSLGLPVVNLGVGGAGPRWFLRHPELLDIVRQARLAVVQVLSGRSVDSSVFDSGGRERLTRRSSGRRSGANASWEVFLREQARASFRLLGRTIHLGAGTPALWDLVAETRSSWVDDTVELLEAIPVPKVVLWLSKRRPEYRPRPSSVDLLFGAFPQLVDRPMLDAVLRRARLDRRRLVECVSRRGSPQPLRDRFTGDPATVSLSVNRPDLEGRWRANSYYPSPEMHQQAAAALDPICREILGEQPP